MLSKDDLAQVTAAIRELSDKGPTLAGPLADTVKASAHSNMKELRPGSSGRSEIRILFAFDPERKAILLVAGDKSGQWKDWYKSAIPLADDRLDEHLQQIRLDKQRRERERNG